MPQLESVIALTREAGRIQCERLGGAWAVEHKVQAINLVTVVDREIDALIVGELRRLFGAPVVVSEEGDHRGAESGDVWIVDPLDGTTNYAHGYPVFAVSIAHRVEGETVLGVVYDPNRDELFCAERGAGAFLNGQRLRVSSTPDLLHALVSTGFPYDRATNPDNNAEQFRRVSRKAQAVRRVGAAALDMAYVAAGRQDGHWERGLGPWDGAAAALLITEAGGRVTPMDGAGRWTPWTLWTVATNGLIHDELARTLRGEATAR
ncbi:MAG: inositol monophosphatase [Chloroflexi bacterium]|nr:inositol monophosphatase [Chloroflexota bacterium]